MLRIILTQLSIFFCSILVAQNDSIKSLSFTAYSEIYYTYDFSNPNNHLRQDFIYNHKRHNELNVNLLLLKTNYQDKAIRTNIGLMAGNYAQYNMSAEPTWAQFIYEANIGINLSKKNDIWIDAGIFSSHYGFESLLQTESWTLTRGMYVENVPYYISGVAISSTNKAKSLYFGAILLNGWQHIQRIDGSQKPSLGLQVKYMPSEKLTVNYCNFLGSDKPDSLKSFRHFHNFYTQYQYNTNIGFVIEANIGFEQSKLSNPTNWFSLVGISRYKFSNKTYTAFRLEYYNDPKNTIVPTIDSDGFKTFSTSINFDYWISKNALFRIESKYYKSKNKLFDNYLKNENWVITSSISMQI